jgi:ArsR family transcriptional regulator, arsenate/arsenite/antimonite-responsive transcriptional repressor
MPDVFKALSDPTRREILRLLKHGDMTAGAIADNFAMSKPSVSHHLSVVKAAGLIDAERRGQEIVYSLNTTVFQDVMSSMLELFGSPEEETRDDE